MKCCDLIINIKPGAGFWPAEMHEPLLTAIYFPLLPPETKYRPWQLRNTKLLEDFRIELRGLQKANKEVDWNCLRELLCTARSIPSMSDELARGLLHETGG